MTETKMSDYDQRQYRLMLDRLTAFEQSKITLNALVVDLEGLLNALDDITPCWKQAFLSDWGKLEEERAYASFKNVKVFDDETSERIRPAVSKLKLLVLEKAEDPADRKSGA
jgi:hypothetical protein